MHFFFSFLFDRFDTSRSLSISKPLFFPFHSKERFSFFAASEQFSVDVLFPPPSSSIVGLFLPFSAREDRCCRGPALAG